MSVSRTNMKKCPSVTLTLCGKGVSLLRGLDNTTVTVSCYGGESCSTVGAASSGNISLLIAPTRKRNIISDRFDPEKKLYINESTSLVCSHERAESAAFNFRWNSQHENYSESARTCTGARVSHFPAIKPRTSKPPESACGRRNAQELWAN